ncbi:MAG: prephenate dehydratase domain-containing protein [Sporolactobacillus sp.]
MPFDLNQARGVLDDIDRQMLTLFEKRMETAAAIARYKEQHALAILDQTREEELLKRARTAVQPKLASYAALFQSQLLALSKALQHETLGDSAPGTQAMARLARSASCERQPHSRPRVIVQGAPGTYAHEAALTMYPQADVTFVKHLSDVFESVQRGTGDYGMLPVENASAGSASDVFDLLRRYQFYIVRAAQPTVRYCLLGVRGSKLQTIQKVCSIPIAFQQCADFLALHSDWQQLASSNTASAAAHVALTRDSTIAALCSRRCADLYGLDILAEGIQQSETNRTRFISIAHQFERPADANKISVLFNLPHQSGSLCQILTYFSNYGMNLTKIESRPNPINLAEYIFYVDFIGYLGNSRTVELLGALADECPNFRFLGNYYDPSVATETKA